MAIRPSYILPTVLLACTAFGPAHAAELGDARVRSYIGQPLSAEVELTLVDDAARPVQARLARPDVYRGANVVMPPVLSGLDIAVIRQGGKQFLRLASLKPVESKHLHVYLELIDGGQRTVRLVTLWLTPDPNPAPVQMPAPVPASAPASTSATAPLAAATVAAAPVNPVVAPPAPKPAKPVPVRKPAAPKRHPAPVAPAPDAHAADTGHAPPAARPAAPVDKAAAEAPKAAALPVPAPACAPAPTAAQVHACAVLGAKNDALRQELGQLEDKVKVLQVATGVKSAHEAEAETAAKAEAESTTAPQATPDAQPEARPAGEAAKVDAKPKSAPRIHRKPKVAEPPEEPTPWLAIGGAVAGLLALAGLALLLRRRRAAAGKALKASNAPEVVVLPQDGNPDAAVAKPGFVAALKARLQALRSRKRPAQAARVEPEVTGEKALAQPE